MTALHNLCAAAAIACFLAGFGMLAQHLPAAKADRITMEMGR